MKCKVFLLMLLLVTGFFPAPLKAQQYALPPSDIYRPERLRTVVITEVAIGLVASAGLYYLWYKKFPKTRFHFFNDNAEWLQMDKVGHMTTAYTLATVQ